MNRCVVFTAAAIVSVVSLHSQQDTNAKLFQSGNMIVVEVTGDHPLEDVVKRLALTYGWAVDYEDPVYSESEVVDISVASWRKEHPHDRGFMVPRSGTFSARFTTSKETLNRKAVITSVVEQYNRTSNLGVFRVVEVSPDRLVVSGRSKGSKSGQSIGDFVISANTKKLNAAYELERVVSDCSKAGDLKVEVAQVPNNALRQAWLEPENGTETCREAFGRIIASTGYKLSYMLQHNVSDNVFFLSIVPAHKSMIDASGHETIVPLR